MKSLLLFMLMVVMSSSAKVQSQPKIDTAYYLLNQSSTNNKIFKQDFSSNYQFYTVECKCLANKLNPILRSNLKQQTALSANAFNALKLLSAEDLIGLLRTTSADEFNKHHTLYFIEADANGYKKSRVFVESSRASIIDVQTIKVKQ